METSSFRCLRNFREQQLISTVAILLKLSLESPDNGNFGHSISIFMLIGLLLLLYSLIYSFRVIRVISAKLAARPMRTVVGKFSNFLRPNLIRKSE